MTSRPCLEPASPMLKMAVGEFNRQEFYKCHKTLEAMWKGESGTIRQLYKGILQMGVAFYHLQAGRPRSATFLLQRARVHLTPFAPHCMGIDLEHLLSSLAHCLERINQQKREGPDHVGWSWIPRIRMRT